MKLPISVLSFIALILFPAISFSQECWAITNIKGYAAYADNDYKFEEDGLKDFVLCFNSEKGYIQGSDLSLLRFGNSTFAGFASTPNGHEVFEVYQLDRINKKLHYTKSLLGVKKIVPLMSDIVLSFVGDAGQSFQ